MADSKITALTSIGTSTDPVLDQMVIVDVSDGSMAATGTTKKVSLNQLLSSNPSATGGLTLSGALAAGSATITGDLTVDTSTLYVSSSADKVAIGTTSLSNEKLTVAGNISANAWLGRSNISAPAGDCSIFRSADNTIGFGIASTTAMTLNSTGLGVGGSPNYKLNLSGAGSSFASSPSIALYDTTVGSPNSRNWLIGNVAANNYGELVFCVSSAAGGAPTNVQMTLNSSGNVGIGVTPSAWGSGIKGLELGSLGSGITSGGTYSGTLYATMNAYNDGSWKFARNAAAGLYGLNSDKSFAWFQSSNAPSVGGAITWTQAMTLDASGNLSVGATAALNSVRIFAERSGGSVAGFNRTTSDGTNVLFYRQGSIVGDVSVTTTGTTFNSTSDYRLKEAVQPLVGGLARVSALKPSIYKWKADGSSGEGFLAHELAEVVPAAVSGEKDAVNEDGSIKPQGVDMSRVVPILVAAIQELAARVQTLETR